MLIVSANHKGGCGKTFLASLLFERALSREIKVIISDLDEQQSLKRRYREAGFTDTPLLHVRTADVCICDTPPSIIANPEILKIIRAADILMVPTFCDKESINATSRVVSLRAGEKDKIVIVANHWEGLSRESQATQYLSGLGVKILLLKKYNRIPLNFDTNAKWDSGLLAYQREAVCTILDEILREVV